MTTRTMSLGDFLTDEEIQRAAQLFDEHNDDHSKFVDAVKTTIVQPNIDRINKALGRENDVIWLSYAVLYVFQRISRQGLN